MPNYFIVVCDNKDEPLSYMEFASEDSITLEDKDGNPVGTRGDVGITMDIPDDNVAMMLFKNTVGGVPEGGDVTETTLVYKLCKEGEVIATIDR